MMSSMNTVPIRRTLPGSLPFSRPEIPAEHTKTRWTAIDILRGGALLAMLITHSAWRIPGFDYRAAYGWDMPLVPDLSLIHVQYGWILQGSSPIFFLLAGFGIAFFCQSRQRKDWTDGQITRYLLIRGLVLVVLDLTVMNIDTEPLAYGYRLSVLTAMGINMWMIAALRRFDWRWIALVAAGVLLATQGYFYLHGIPQGSSMIRAVLLAPGGTEAWLVLFPALPWLPVMLLGFISGLLVAQGKVLLPVYAAFMGVTLLCCWILVDADAGFGNLYPDNPLIFGKHPPDLSFLLVYPGVGFLLICANQMLTPLRHMLPVSILVQFGQTSLFFYLIHTRVLTLVSYLIPADLTSPAMYSLLLTGVSIPILFFLCKGYAHLKARYPGSVLQYL
jgi:uncharacterized membrane protein